METCKATGTFSFPLPLLDLPIRDGNGIGMGGCVSWTMAFRPSYQGWKPEQGARDTLSALRLLDLPIRDGNSKPTSRRGWTARF